MKRRQDACSENHENHRRVSLRFAGELIVNNTRILLLFKPMAAFQIDVVLMVALSASFIHAAAHQPVMHGLLLLLLLLRFGLLYSNFIITVCNRCPSEAAQRNVDC